MRIERIEKSKHKQERVLVFLEGGDLPKIPARSFCALTCGRVWTSPALTVVGAERRRPQQSLNPDRGADGVGTDAVQKAGGAAPSTKKGRHRERRTPPTGWRTLGAVDDEGYAGVIVRHYGAMGYGPGRVKQELHRRGVPRELWDEALAQLPPAADAVRKVVAARLRGRPMTQEDSRKLAAALQRRGFSWNDIRPVLNEWGQEIDET